MAAHLLPLAERFERFTTPEPMTGCLLWLGRQNSRGYAQISVRNQTFTAHRIAWSLANGPIPLGLLVLHRCDQPLCVNPRHLFLGTHSDNHNDKVRKGRDHNASKTHCAKGHPFSSENTHHRKTGRSCRACGREKYHLAKARGDK